MIEVRLSRGMWREPRGFSLRQNGGEEYVFLHFKTPVLIEGQRYETGTYVLYGMHEWRCFSSPECELIHDWFHATGEVAELAKDAGIELSKPCTLPYSDFITGIITEIELEVLQKRIGWRELAAAKVCELFARINRAGKESTALTEGTAYREEFLKLRTEVMLRYNEKWSIEKMAEKVTLSVSRFYQLYREIFGITPQKDLQCTRIEHAKQLLTQGNHTVSEISELIGYNSTYHFIRQFKLLCGVSPGKYILNKNNDRQSLTFR